MVRTTFALSFAICLTCSLLFPLSSFSKESGIDQDAIIKAHNRLRNEVGAPNIKWSDNLAQKAASYIATMQKKGCRMRHNGPGENLYWASPLRSATQKNAFGQWIWEKSKVQNISANYVVERWGDEKKWYSSSRNSCSAPMGKTCGHYTQVVWSDTTHVGCAKAVCKDKSQVWLCVYSPAGNIIGQRPY